MNDSPTHYLKAIIDAEEVLDVMDRKYDHRDVESALEIFELMVTQLEKDIEAEGGCIYDWEPYFHGVRDMVHMGGDFGKGGYFNSWSDLDTLCREIDKLEQVARKDGRFPQPEMPVGYRGQLKIDPGAKGYIHMTLNDEAGGYVLDMFYKAMETHLANKHLSKGPEMMNQSTGDRFRLNPAELLEALSEKHSSEGLPR